MTKLVSSKDITGDSGELFATGLLMTGGLFFAIVIGGKTPSFDVQAMINDDSIPFPLLIQIKTTSKRNRYNKKSIKTRVPPSTISQLAAMPIPTYVAGYDLVDHILYIAPVFSGNEKYPSIPIKHKIELKNPARAVIELNILKDDVIAFFNNKVTNIQMYKKSYSSQL